MKLTRLYSQYWNKGWRVCSFFACRHDRQTRVTLRKIKRHQWSDQWSNPFWSIKNLIILQRLPVWFELMSHIVPHPIMTFSNHFSNSLSFNVSLSCPSILPHFPPTVVLLKDISQPCLSHCLHLTLNYCRLELLALSSCLKKTTEYEWASLIDILHCALCS